MNSQEFVRSLNMFLIPEAGDACLKELISPTALTPPSVLELSHRFKSLSETDRDFVKRLITCRKDNNLSHSGGAR